MHLIRNTMAAALLALAVPHLAAAQAEVSIKGGASFGNVSNKGVLPGDLGGRTGFAAGAGVAQQFGLVGVGFEALFDQRGAKSNASGTGDGFMLDYLDIPLYLRVVIPTPGIKPFVYAGPQVSFELRCRNVDTDCVDTSRKKTDYAGVIGAGVKIGDKTGLTIEGRYVYGLTDLKLGTVTDANSYKTRTFLLLAGIAL